MAPFGDYEDFGDCVADNQDKDSPEGFCAWLEHETTGEWPSEVDSDRKHITHIPDRKNVKVVQKEDGDHLSTPISSLSEDRDGDQFSADGLQSMAKQINNSVNGIPLYEDHGGSTGNYPASEMRGKFVHAEIENNKLMGDVKFDSEDEEAEWIKGKIERGLPIGFSVGFTPTQKRKKKDTDGQIFDDVDLLEVSAVGIPSNQDAINVLNYNSKSIDKLAESVKEKLELENEEGEKTMSEEEGEDTEEQHDELSKDDVREIVKEELKDALEEDEEKDEESEEKQEYDKEELESMIRDIVQEELGKEEEEDEDEEEEDEEEKDEEQEQEPKGASSPSPEKEKDEMKVKGIRDPLKGG